MRKRQVCKRVQTDIKICIYEQKKRIRWSRQNKQISSYNKRKRRRNEKENKLVKNLLKILKVNKEYMNDGYEYK